MIYFNDHSFHLSNLCNFRMNLFIKFSIKKSLILLSSNLSDYYYYLLTYIYSLKIIKINK